MTCAQRIKEWFCVRASVRFLLERTNVECEQRISWRRKVIFCQFPSEALLKSDIVSFTIYLWVVWFVLVSNLSFIAEGSKMKIQGEGMYVVSEVRRSECLPYFACCV